MKTVTDFLRDIQDGTSLPRLPEHLKALWWARKGDWDRSHDIAQDAGSEAGDWVHAYLHRVEGDLGNAAYWYRRANKPIKARENLEEEWKELVTLFESLQGGEEE